VEGPRRLRPRGRDDRRDEHEPVRLAELPAANRERATSLAGILADCRRRLHAHPARSGSLGAIPCASAARAGGVIGLERRRHAGPLDVLEEGRVVVGVAHVARRREDRHHLRDRGVRGALLPGVVAARAVRFAVAVDPQNEVLAAAAHGEALVRRAARQDAHQVAADHQMLAVLTVDPLAVHLLVDPVRRMLTVTWTFLINPSDRLNLARMNEPSMR